MKKGYFKQKLLLWFPLREAVASCESLRKLFKEKWGYLKKWVAQN